MQKFLLLVLENIKHQKQTFNAIIIDVKDLILQSPSDRPIVRPLNCKILTPTQFVILWPPTGKKALMLLPPI